MPVTILCDVYRSRRVDGMYLYVDRGEGLVRVPEDLMKRFGNPELALGLVLNAGKQLARANAREVMQAITEQGFYLQMPPRNLGGMA